MEFVAYFVHAAWPSLLAIAGGWPVVWFVTEFLLRPVRHFFDLKREAKALTILLWRAPEYGRQDPEDWQRQMSELKGKRDRLTELGAEMFSFSQSEKFATWAVRILRYDPAGAGLAAERLAFELGTDIEDRDKNYRKLDTALRFSFDPKRPFYDPYHPEFWKKPKRRTDNGQPTG
jgi:hypothetical protein